MKTVGHLNGIRLAPVLISEPLLTEIIPARYLCLQYIVKMENSADSRLILAPYLPRDRYG